MRIHISEQDTAIAAVLVGLIAALIIAPWNGYFLSNFAFYWGSQVAVLLGVLLFKPSAIAISGVATALATYLAIFATWLLSRERPDSMAWLGYVFSLPGALVAAIISSVAVKKASTRLAFVTWAIVFGCVSLGIAANQAAVCLTVMHCTGK